MICWGNTPRGISANERSGYSASCVLGTGAGNRAFSGFPTMTSSKWSHSLQLQTAGILDGFSRPIEFDLLPWSEVLEVAIFAFSKLSFIIYSPSGRVTEKIGH